MSTKQKNNINSKNWQQVKLGDVANVKNGKSNTQDAVPDGEYIFFDRSTLTKRSNQYLFDTEAVILPGEGKEFTPKYYKGKFDLHQRAYAITPLKKVDGKFLYYFLDKNKDSFLKTSVGSTVRSLRLPYIQDVDVLLPPLPEQQKIAEILGAVDEEIEKVSEEIQKSEELKRGLLNELIQNERTRYEKACFSDVAEINNGQVDPKVMPYKAMILIAPNHIEQESGRIIEKKTAQEQRAISGKYLVKKGQVIYSKIRPYLKKVAIAEEDCLCSADMYPISGNDKALTSYLFYVLLSKPFTDYAVGASARTGIPKINRDELNTYTFHLPSLQEQKQIVAVLSSIDEKINISKKLKNNLTKLKKGLMQDLLSGSKRLDL